jgi:hypothetical protein
MGMATSANHQYSSVSFLTQEDCKNALNLRPRPEEFYCLRYESARRIDWTPPQPKEEPPPAEVTAPKEEPVSQPPPVTRKQPRIITASSW